MATQEHTIRVRFTGWSHQAVDERTYARATRTSGHEEAALAVLKGQGLRGTLERAEHLEKALHNPARKEWEQWRVYIVKAAE